MNEFEKDRARYRVLFEKARTGGLSPSEFGEILALGNVIYLSLENAIKCVLTDLSGICVAFEDGDMDALGSQINAVSEKSKNHDLTLH